jgi:indolepyruvate ferredoxin oxidoreductase
VIACDLIVGSGPDVLTLTRPDTRVLANEDVVPTGEFQTNRNMDLNATRFISAIGKRVEAANIETLRAGALAARLLGDTIFTNLMMVGFAAQKGLLPVSLASIEEAIRLNGVAAKANLNALGLGRLAAVDADGLFDLADAPVHEAKLPRTLTEVTESRAALLAKFQNDAYAAEYRAFLDETAKTLKARDIADAEPFLTETAKGLGKLMAYKDEYEVARLYSDPAFIASLRDQFDSEAKLKLNLGAPYLSFFRKDAKTGRPKKVELGAWWVLPLFRVMAKLKGLRGTPLDLFGYQAERRKERALIGEYRALIRDVAGKVTPDTMPAAVGIAASADLVAGYGPVKDAGVEAYRARVADLLPKLASSSSSERLPEPA